MAQPEEVKEEVDPNEPVDQGRNKPFTPEEFDVVWKKFTAKKEAEDRVSEVMILKGKYELDGFSAAIQIPNEALEQTFEKFRFDLLEVLRNELENDKIVLTTKVVEISEDRMLYTDQEKFEHLKKKYPALKELQDKLGLDPQF